LVAFWPADVTVKATRTDVADTGTVKEQRATPALNDCVCATAFAAAVGRQTVSPRANGAPVSERLTFTETASGCPATAWAGVETAFPIIGFAARSAPAAVGKPKVAAASARIVIELIR
jgi:hypothetical protein